ncbi:hypothetical protein DSECCO2_533480 [anaerobic digester metagenome]
MKIDVFAWILTGFKILDKIEVFVKKWAKSEKYQKTATMIAGFSYISILALCFLSYVGYSSIYLGKIMYLVLILWQLPQLVFATISVRSMIKYLFVNLILIMGTVYLLMVTYFGNVNYWIIVLLYCILWVIIALISEIEVAKMANNIIITATTIVITGISIIIGIPDVGINNVMLLVFQGFMLVFLPFLCTALISNLIVQAKEYWQKKYRVKKTGDLCKFITDKKSE